MTSGRPISERADWVSGLALSIDLRLDGLALTMSLIVSIVGVGVLVYAAHYFPAGARDLGRWAGLLVLFGGSMLGLVQADHMLVLYACWELTSVTSFLLIGNRHTESRARAAALHALLVTSAGGLAMLGGLVIVARESGTFLLSGLVRQPPAGGAAMSVAVVLLLVAAFTKSAQYPFHAWLPGAMAAPTPVSAYLHSATMVKAGVVLVARLAPGFAATGVWRPLVLSAGSATMIFGGLRALRQHDLKLLLAFGTVSQLGLLMVLFGAGTPATATAGWVLLVAHAGFKATLFMVVGIIDHQTGTRDLRRIPALDRGWRPLELVTALAAISMAGIPLGGRLYRQGARVRRAHRCILSRRRHRPGGGRRRIDADDRLRGAVLLGGIRGAAPRHQYASGAGAGPAVAALHPASGDPRAGRDHPRDRAGDG